VIASAVVFTGVAVVRLKGPGKAAQTGKARAAA
jgi:hypothetical protein